MPTVTVHTPDGAAYTAELPVGEPLAPVLRRAGMAFPCAGNHTCGKCRVRALGALPAPDARERALLGGAGEGARLACLLTALGDCTLYLEEPGGARALTGSEAADYPLDPVYTGYGAAFDIGTTTVAGYLFSAREKGPLAASAGPNRQAPWGADVISRVQACRSGALLAQRDAVRGQLSELLAGLCGRAGVAKAEVAAVVCAGNTAMLHLLCGLSPEGLAAAPFTPASLFGDWRDDFRLDGFPKARVYLPGCVSAFVGADITCAVLASGMLGPTGTALLADIGTNGEMALWDGRALRCCATAAGPAFEGAGISCGSGAQNGAVDAAWWKGGALGYHVLGGAPARSVCGSGLLDAAAALLDGGLLDGAGLIAGEGGFLPLGDSGLTLTQADFRQLQLAKAAVCAGMETLLHESGLERADRLLLCGGFGSFLRRESALRVGLCPRVFEGRVRAIGNAAGAGAGLLLQSRAAMREAGRIARMARVLELSENAFFMRRYVDDMLFPEEETECK